MCYDKASLPPLLKVDRGLGGNLNVVSLVVILTVTWEFPESAIWAVAWTKLELEGPSFQIVSADAA
jgi:hypothetical protein